MITTKPWVWSAERTTSKSVAPSAARPWSFTPTATRRPAPRTASRKSTRPTRCSATRKSAPATTVSATPASNGGDRPFDGFDPFGGFGDIFDTFFGGGGGRTANQPRAGEDIAQRINLSFEEAVFGCEKDIELNRVEPCHRCSGAGNEPGTPITTCLTCSGTGQVRRAQRSVFGQFAVTTPCSACNGSGRKIETPCSNCRARGFERRRRTRTVTIPAGIADGMQVRITGEGDAGSNGGPPGNLYVQVRVQEHPVFVRDEDDLVLRMGLNIAEAALGSTKSVPTLEGEDVDLEIPGGTHSGNVYRVRGMGVPRLRRDGRPTDRRGDIRVVVDVDVPQRLNKYQRKLLEDLAYSFDNRGKAPPAEAGSNGKGRRSGRGKAENAEESEPATAEEPDEATENGPAEGAVRPHQGYADLAQRLIALCPGTS